METRTPKTVVPFEYQVQSTVFKTVKQVVGPSSTQSKRNGNKGLSGVLRKQLWNN